MGARSIYRSITRQPQINRAATSIARKLGRRGKFYEGHLPRLGSVVAHLPNGRTLRMIAEEAEAVSNHIFWRGWDGHEPEMSSRFFETAKSADRIVDVGAHVGYFSLLAAHANPTAEVFALEPLPHVADRLERHARLNGLPNIQVYRSAAADWTGSARLRYTTAIPVPSASALEHVAGMMADQSESIEVPVVTLDDVVDGRRVDLIKVDTEATEPDVLLGARRILEKDRPTIFCEVLDFGGTAAKLDEILDEFDYQRELLTDDGTVLHERINPHAHWRNWLFTPQG